MPDKMVGDINFFLYPWDDEKGEDKKAIQTGGVDPRTTRSCVGEVDIMVAERSERGRGFGKAAVSAFLHYIYRNLKAILQEYDAGHANSGHAGKKGELELKLFMVKINESNAASLALFKSLGFQQRGSVNYFGEVELVLEDYVPLVSQAPEGYVETAYRR